MGALVGQSAGDVPFLGTSPSNQANIDGIVPVFGTLPALVQPNDI